MGIKVKLTSHVDEVKNASEEAIERALEAMGQQCVSFAKQELDSDPVRIDTGLLVNSLAYAVSGKEATPSEYKADRPRKGKSEVEKGSYSGNAPKDGKTRKAVYVGTNVEYAIYVHDGTSKMSPNRFLKKAVTKNKDVFRQIAEQELKKG